ncbi:MAG: FAD-binding protein [Herpetosiphonaceae bacterium]|nr:FAD-binding protein [Herpetosiphonaceae bacterium]
MIQHDVVIVGSGIAGMRCALEIKRQAPEADVALVSKLYPVRSPSVIERGGVAAALGNVLQAAQGIIAPSRQHRSTADSVESHMGDTLAYGGGTGDAAAVAALCGEAPQVVYELEHMGAPFSRTVEGRIAQVAGAGHSNPRLAYAADRTGHAILHTLYGELVRYGIKIYPEWFLLSLLVEEGAARGITALDIRSGEVEVFNAKITVFATGSYGRIFGITSDAQSSTGDGLAAASRAGIALKGLDQVGFHPLGLADLGFVISERALLDGGYLLNSAEERFMGGYSALAERAPLADVSRAIASEIAAGRGVGAGKDHVWLDVRHLPAQHVREHFPHLIEFAQDYLGLDPFDALIPVQPTAHATLGGIPTDVNGRVADVRRFYAVGACANNGVHGAAPLPGNELAAALVFGRRAGAAIAKQLGEKSFLSVPAEALATAKTTIKALLNQKGTGRAATVREQLLSSMSASNGVQRHYDALTEQIGRVRVLRNDFAGTALQDKGTLFNTELVEALEVANMLEISEVAASAAVEQLAAVAA